MIKNGRIEKWVVKRSFQRLPSWKCSLETKRTILWWSWIFLDW